MPKKTSSGERRSSTRLFRSVSALSSRRHKDNTGKDVRERTSSGLSDSDRNDSIPDRDRTLNRKNDGQRCVENLESDLREMRSRLDEMTAKLREAELENENLKSLIGANYEGPIKLPTDEIESNESDAKLSSLKGLQGPIRTIACPVGDHPTENVIEASGYAINTSHSNHCKECDKLKETTIKALVEAIALRKYVKQLSTALSGDDHAKRNILEVLEKKLISAQTEKEIALEELAHVIEQRDQIVNERDRALEEWGKAATKWDSTLDHVDSLMKELNKVKSSREDMVSQIEKAENRIKQEVDSREKLLEDFAELNEQLNSTERERIDTMSEHDRNITKYRFDREQEFQKTKIELGKSQQRCLELDAKLTSLGEKSESCKKERDHAKEQWRHSVKERKKLNREMAAIIQARDEAIQKCFSTAEKLDKLKEDYNRLLNRLARTGLTSSDSASSCSSKDCHFCSQDSSGSIEDVHRPDGKEVTTILGKEDPLDSIKIGCVTNHARSFTVIMGIDKALGAAKNVRIYDEIISINDIPVSENDQNLVRSLLDGATSSIKLILRRPVNNCQFTFDVEMKMPKKSKSGLGFDCGLYVKGLSQDQFTLDIGDYVHKINGKHLDKIISSSVEKVIKKSTDKVKFNITRTIKVSSHVHEPRAPGKENVKVVLRRLSGNNSKSPSNDVNRLSLISNDSSISMRSRDSRLSGASSLGSMASNNDSCFADSSSDLSGPIHSTPIAQVERSRMATAIYIPSSEQLEEMPGSTDFLTSVDGSDETKRIKRPLVSQMGRKYNSTTVLRSGGYDSSGSEYCLTRTQSTIAATRIDEEDRWDVGLGRTGTFEILAPTSDRVRVMRLEKEMFTGLGLEIEGGNLIGIYVKELTDDSVCKTAGLKVGDRLIKLNCYDFTRTTLDHATRIVRLLSSCTYVRIEAESGEVYKDVLKQTPHDSIYVRTINSYKAMSPDELSFTVGEMLHVINTRANYDKAKHSWKWVAMRKDGKNIDEGLVPCMGSLRDEVETAITASQVIAKLDAESVEELGSDDGGAPMKRGGSERKSFLQRYRKMRKRDSRDPYGSGVDVNGNSGKVTYYEILSKLK